MRVVLNRQDGCNGQMLQKARDIARWLKITECVFCCVFLIAIVFHFVFLREHVWEGQLLYTL
jgi:hypothetical protein